MRIIAADDTKLHINFLRSTIEKLNSTNAIGEEVELISTCENGQRLFQEVTANQDALNLILCDIRMPICDGLTALVRIKQQFSYIPMIMVSSESPKTILNMNQLRGAKQNLALEDTKKEELLNKVVQRIRTDKSEPGKINSILEACEKLGLDPIFTAMKMGAQGYVSKPYDVNKLTDIITRHIAGEEFPVSA